LIEKRQPQRQHLAAAHSLPPAGATFNAQKSLKHHGTAFAIDLIRQNLSSPTVDKPAM
jgi:hypothetical protein